MCLTSATFVRWGVSPEVSTSPGRVAARDPAALAMLLAVNALRVGAVLRAAHLVEGERREPRPIEERVETWLWNRARRYLLRNGEHL